MIRNMGFADDWFCRDCEHGPMSEGDSNCHRCGGSWDQQNNNNLDEEEDDG